MASFSTALTSKLVNESARPLITNVNPQVSVPPFPLIYYDQVTVQSGGEQAFRSEAFTNLTRRPVEIHSMRTTVQLISPSAGANVFTRALGQVALSIDVAGYPVTHGAVPVWSLCRSDNRLSEDYTLNRMGSLCWYFSQPVPLMPGQGIQITAKHLGFVTVPAQVSLSFAGRISPKPIARRIPYTASWSSRFFAYAEVASDVSPPSQIVNASGRDLVVDRIIGRSVARNDRALNDPEIADFNDYTLQGVTSFRIRMSLAQGRPILRTYTPWRTVFGQNAALETSFILAKGDYLVADVGHIAGPTGLNFTSPYSQNQGVVSIVGWREV